jgi:hypothetical protein
MAKLTPYKPNIEQLEAKWPLFDSELTYPNETKILSHCEIAGVHRFDLLRWVGLSAGANSMDGW